jgi:hypothetical protein
MRASALNRKHRAELPVEEVAEDGRQVVVHFAIS